MEVVVREGNEAVLFVEVAGLGINSQDLDRKQAELIGQVEAATQGIAQEPLCQAPGPWLFDRPPAGQAR